MNPPADSDGSDGVRGLSSADGEKVTAPSGSGPDSALRAVAEGYQSRFASAGTEQLLREENAKLLGKKGELTAALRHLGTLPPGERKAFGESINALKREIEKAFEARLTNLANFKRHAELNAPPYDLSLPGRPLGFRGHKHLLSTVSEEIVDLFRSLGFALHEGPQIDTEENNFTKLGFPADHPAIDMQDSFWTQSGLLLRTHTSNVQVRAMTTHRPPMAFVSTGTVYRRDDDATHSPMFHQLEAFLVDTRVTVANLKGILTEFAERFFGSGTSIRLRPSYFPFVEPGAEVDIGCVFCKGADGRRSGCALCKHTGWIEVLGCGMIHPVVFEHCGIDSEAFTGFALGMGIERLTILRYGIPDIRLFFENDPRFLSQF